MRPTVHALVICDAVYKEPVTGKYSLLGMFSAISAADFPVEVPPFAVYAAVSGIRSRALFDLRLVGLDPEDGSESIVGQGNIELTADSPVEVAEIALPMPKTLLPEEGDYRFRVEWQGEAIAERRIIVKLRGDIA